jgi:hypothetical protein
VTRGNRDIRSTWRWAGVPPLSDARVRARPDAAPYTAGRHSCPFESSWKARMSLECRVRFHNSFSPQRILRFKPQKRPSIRLTRQERRCSNSRWSPGLAPSRVAALRYGTGEGLSSNSGRVHDQLRHQQARPQETATHPVLLFRGHQRPGPQRQATQHLCGTAEGCVRAGPNVLVLQLVHRGRQLLWIAAPGRTRSRTRPEQAPGRFGRRLVAPPRSRARADDAVQCSRRP